MQFDPSSLRSVAIFAISSICAFPILNPLKVLSGELSCAVTGAAFVGVYPVHILVFIVKCFASEHGSSTHARCGVARIPQSTTRPLPDVSTSATVQALVVPCAFFSGIAA